MTETNVVFEPAVRTGETLLEVDDLTVVFDTEDGVVQAVSDMTWSLAAGETLAILGESGSGKSVSVQTLMGLIPQPPGRVVKGSIRYRGEEIIDASPAEYRRIRGPEIAMIFQDPLSALNPVYRVGWQIAEMFRVHRGASRADAKQQAIALMERVGIPNAARRARQYPHEFSGGMRQRAMIAMALALDPKVLIADEPTTALDVTVQAQIMELLQEIQRDTGMGLVLITHDLGVVASVADRVVVMYAGRAVESGPADPFYAAPAHPYSQGLMNSVPRLLGERARLESIPGSPPSAIGIPTGCAFHPRCPHAQDQCHETRPELVELADRPGSAACLRIGEF
ncbi:MAG: ABC transporter ATP-binding protein [Acidimicrobiales bacterium]|nr:ABC transporter ATP-binding protein [Acidimicrobiales bacterium]